MTAAPLVESLPLYSTEPRPGLARIFYGQAHGGTLTVPLRQLGAEPLFEIWPDTHGLIFGTASIEEPGALEPATRDLYARLIEEVHASGHPHFVRMWNYVGSINAFDGGRERYQLFCAGRHDAFDAAGHRSGDLPSASAVGMPGRGLVTYFLASDRPGRQIENPRQTSAYRYPPRYGAKSPSFARATLWGETLFVSGTSSIVGHETLHAGDLEAQLDETLRNIEAVIAQGIAGGSLGSVLAAKTYIRHPHHYETVARRLESVLPVNLYLEADICRADLLLEIEVVAR